MRLDQIKGNEYVFGTIYHREDSTGHGLMTATDKLVKVIGKVDGKTPIAPASDGMLPSHVNVEYFYKGSKFIAKWNATDDCDLIAYGKVCQCKDSDCREYYVFGGTELSKAYCHKHVPVNMKKLVTFNGKMVTVIGKVTSREMDQFDRNWIYNVTFNHDGVEYKEQWNEGDFDTPLEDKSICSICEQMILRQKKEKEIESLKQGGAFSQKKKKSVYEDKTMEMDSLVKLLSPYIGFSHDSESLNRHWKMYKTELGDAITQIDCMFILDSFFNAIIRNTDMQTAGQFVKRMIQTFNSFAFNVPTK